MGMSRAGLCFVVLALVQPALAEGGPAARPAAEVRVPNFLGATGLLLTPTAYVQRDREISAFGAGSPDLVAGGIEAGIRNRFEAGAGVIHRREGIGDGRTKLLGNARLNLFRETLTLP